MNTKTKMRLLSLLLCLVMLLGVLPLSAFAEGRTVVSEITATTPSGEIAPVYGEEMPFIELTVTSGKMISIPGSMYFWQKLNGSNWEQQTPGAKFHEGTYRYSAQFRIDGDYGTTHKLNSENVTVTVDGVTWETGRIAVDTDFSYVFAYSPAFVVELSEGEDPIEPITDLTATVTEPVAGEKPDLEPEPGSTDYSVRVDGWFEGGNLLEFDFGTEITDPENYTFKADENYILVVRFQCENEAKEIVEEAQATINGIPAASLGGGYFATSFGDTTVVDIEIKNGAAPSEFTDTQSRALSLLENNELLVWDEELPICFDSEGKTLFAIIRNTIVLAKDVTADDNFIYTLTLEERAGAYALFGVDMTQIHVTFNNESDEDSVITIEMETGNNMADYTDDQHQGRGILVDKGLLSYDEDLDIWTDSEGKTLFSIDDSGLVAVADGVTAEDNIVYELSLEDQIYTGIIASEIRLVFVPNEDTTYTVSFDANGGTGTMADVTGVSGEYTLPACTFTAPDGKQFKAWSVGGVEKAVGDKITVIANTTVSAVWEEIPTATTINTINIKGITAPVAGNAPVITGITTDTAGLSLATIQWQLSGGVILNSTDKFEAGQTYYLYVRYEVADGYELSDAVTVTSDLANSTYEINTMRVKFQYTVPAAPKYTVTVTGGTVDGKASVTTEAGTRLQLRAPEVAGKRFTGWSGLDGITLYGDNAKVTDHILQFIMPAKNFTVTANYQDAVEITTINIKGITTPLVGANPVRTGITTDTTGLSVKDAIWYFKSNSTSVAHDYKFQLGDEIKLLIVFDVADGYTFADTVTITADLEYTAAYRGLLSYGTVYLEYTVTEEMPTTYTVSFDANGGTGTMADVTGVSGEYTLPACTFTAPDGKQFKAWSVGGAEKAVGDKITVTANTTVSAVWEEIPTATTIDTIDIGGLAKPVVGEMPDNSITVNGTGVTVGDDGSYWGRFDSTRFNPYYDDDTAVDGVVFRDGETYMFQLYLYAEDGYEFTEDTEFYFAGKLLPAPDMDDLSKSFAMVNPDDRTVAVVYINMNDIAHEHVAGDWEHNDTHHWHKCTASGCDAGSDLTKLPDYAEHSFVGGICTCGAHQHNWSAEWSVNETHHWHECTADGCTATDNSGKAGYAAHNFIGGVCECGVENVITSIEIGSITAPVVGETPVNSASVDKMGAKVDEDGTFWVRYDPSTGRTTDTYADGTFVYNTPFREGEIYLLQITIDLESGYSFAANVKILYKGDELPAPDAANPTASCAAIAPDGSLAMALINPTGASAPVTYTVTFDANGGTGTMAPATGVSGEYTLPACTFTAPSGKQFKAWSVDGAEKAVGDKIAVTADTTVSAVWEDIPHTCTLTPVAKVEPTCTEGGKEAYFKCDECGKCYEDENGKSEIADINTWGNIEASGHTESDWITSDSEHWKECTVEDCGREIADSRAEHADNDGDGKCDTCESTLAQPPKTGDHTVLILLGALVSGALLTLLGVRKRKEDN